MNRRAFAISLTSFALHINSAKGKDQTEVRGIGLTVREWLDVYGDPAQYTKPTGLLGSRPSAIYRAGNHTLDISTPFDDPDNIVSTIFVRPDIEITLTYFQEICEQYLPSDYKSYREYNESRSTTYVDYSSEALADRFRFESDQALDGTIRIAFKRGSGNLYEWCAIYLGTYTFI